VPRYETLAASARILALIGENADPAEDQEDEDPEEGLFKGLRRITRLGTY
jgi:hypothetical protein